MMGDEDEPFARDHDQRGRAGERRGRRTAPWVSRHAVPADRLEHGRADGRAPRRRAELAERDRRSSPRGHVERAPVSHAACAVKMAAAAVLERGADLLEATGGDCAELCTRRWPS